MWFITRLILMVFNWCMGHFGSATSSLNWTLNFCPDQLGWNWMYIPKLKSSYKLTVLTYMRCVVCVQQFWRKIQPALNDVYTTYPKGHLTISHTFTYLPICNMFALCTTLHCKPKPCIGNSLWANSHREIPVFITGNPCSHCRVPVLITGISLYTPALPC